MAKSPVTLAHAAELMHHFQTVLHEHPPAGPTQLVHESPSQLRIGDYLYALGYATASQLSDIGLHRHVPTSDAQQARFGQVLVERGVVHPKVLGAVLAVQLVDRLMETSFRPRLLGEYLVALGLLSPLRLAAALHEQSCALADGAPVLLGDVLMRQRALPPAALERGLYVQQTVERTRREHPGALA